MKLFKELSLARLHLAVFAEAGSKVAAEGDTKRQLLGERFPNVRARMLLRVLPRRQTQSVCSNFVQLGVIFRYMYREVPLRADRSPFAIPLRDELARCLSRADAENVRQ